MIQKGSRVRIRPVSPHYYDGVIRRREKNQGRVLAAGAMYLVEFDRARPQSERWFYLCELEEIV